MFSQQNGAKQLALPGYCDLKKSTEGLFQRLLNNSIIPLFVKMLAIH